MLSGRGIKAGSSATAVVEQPLGSGAASQPRSLFRDPATQPCVLFSPVTRRARRRLRCRPAGRRRSAAAAHARPRTPPPSPRSTKTGNIMFDRRVVRGSTVAQPIVPPSVAAEAAAAETKEAARKARKAAEARERADAEAAARANEVPPVAGRLHHEVRARGWRRRRARYAPQAQLHFGRRRFRCRCRSASLKY